MVNEHTLLAHAYYSVVHVSKNDLTFNIERGLELFTIMANINLLEIDVDQLFINFTIKEIQDVDKKIQSEIEKKRQELRYMVGLVYVIYIFKFLFLLLLLYESELHNIQILVKDIGMY